MRRAEEDVCAKFSWSFANRADLRRSLYRCLSRALDLVRMSPFVMTMPTGCWGGWDILRSTLGHEQ